MSIQGESWQGNSWGVRITPRGLYLQDWSENYPLDTAHDVMIKYWMFLTAGSPNEATAEVNEWEAKAGRAHPCRPHL